MNKKGEENRCLQNFGCPKLIKCSFCGGCEEHHKINLEANKCECQREMEKENDCCWNEELKEWYELESIGVNNFRCLGCFKRFEE